MAASGSHVHRGIQQSREGESFSSSPATGSYSSALQETKHVPVDGKLILQGIETMASVQWVCPKAGINMFL